MLRALVSMELKGMRLYKTFLLVNLFVMPFSLLFMMIMNSKTTDPLEISYLVSGFIIVSIVSSLIGTLTNRVSNIFEPSVLELYATLPPRISHVVLAQFIAYSLFVLPQVLGGMALIVHYLGIHSINYPLLFLALLLAFIELGSLGVFIGAKIANPYKILAVTSILPWVLIVFSPAYYHSNFIGFLFNPVTHLLACVRCSLGLQANCFISCGVSVVLSLLFLGLSIKTVHTTYMLEKPF